MRIIFMGTGEIGLPSLRWLFEESGHDVVGVFTQPDRAVGRSGKLQPPQVKVVAEAAEIGLLKALGASESHIIKLFLLQGVIVGILGVALGLIWAHLLIEYRNEILNFVSEKLNVQVFDPKVYNIEGGLPAQPTVSDSLTISLFAFIACALSSLIPAWMAARLQPAEALRNE